MDCDLTKLWKLALEAGYDSVQVEANKYRIKWCMFVIRVKDKDSFLHHGVFMGSTYKKAFKVAHKELLAEIGYKKTLSEE